MKEKNRTIYMLIGVITFIIAKIVFSYIGIKNVPVPIIVALLVVSYTMFLIGTNNKKLKEEEKRHYIACSVLLAITFSTTIIIVMFLKYFPEKIEQEKYLILAVIILNILSLLGISIITTLIRRKRHN